MVVCAMGQVGNQMANLEQVVAEYYRKEERRGNGYVVYELYLCKVGIIFLLLKYLSVSKMSYKADISRAAHE